MKQKLVSIVVPIYNAELFLERCIDSLVDQSYQQIEILLIDDKSTDESFSICQSRAFHDQRIKVLQKENSGVSDTRNLGIENAIGDYLLFVDADDWLNKDYIEKLVEKATEDNLDFIKTNYYKVFNNGYKQETIFPIDGYTIFTDKKKEIVYDLLTKSYAFNSVWGILFKKEIISDIRFKKEMIIAEDFLFVLCAIEKATKFAFTNETKYYYFINQNGAIRNNNQKKLLQKIENLKMVYSYLIETCDLLQDNTIKEQAVKKFYFEIYTTFLLCALHLSYKEYKKVINHICDEIYLKYNGLLKNNSYNIRKNVVFRYLYIQLIYKPKFYLKHKIINIINHRELTYFIKAYNVKNLGDDLFVYLLEKRYQNRSFKITHSPFLRVFNKVIQSIFFHTFTLENIIKRRCDVVVHIGGSLFIEDSLEKWKKRLCWYYKKPAKPYYILGCNFGPYQTEEFRELIETEAFSNAQDVCFREQDSYQLFSEQIPKRLASDIVFQLDATEFKSDDSNTVIFSVIDLNRKADLKNKKKQYENKIVEMIKFFQSKDYDIVLMSFCKYEGDEDAIQSILSKCDEQMKNRISKFYYNGNMEQALRMIAGSKIIVGTRFHANILGMLFGKTVIPISYSDKTIHLLRDMNFKGKQLDVRTISDFDVQSITSSDLKYIQDVEFQKKDSEKQFYQLDKILKKKRGMKK